MKISKTFIGYTNFKWLVIELLKIGTVKPKFFSKKRIESGVAFIVGQFGMIYFLLEKIESLIKEYRTLIRVGLKYKGAQ